MTPQAFDIIRKAFGKLNQGQVDGINRLAVHLAMSGLPVKHQAYLLATSWHETAATMQPIHERGKVAYFNKYEPGTRIGRDLGNTQPGDGYRFRGRGYVQLTGRANYTAAGRKLKLDLVGNPDLALEPDHAAAILIAGCRDGWFTTKKLSDYADYENMRRVVNGTDRAALIAGYARTFEAALAANGRAATAPEAPRPAPTPQKKPTQASGAKKWTVAGAVAAIIAAIAAWVTNGGTP